MKSRNLPESFSHAFRGIFQAFVTERNVRLDIMTGILAVSLGFLLELDTWEWCIILLLVGFVTVAELLNTAIEYTVDMVCGDNYNELAKYSKDIAAGATLIAAITSVIVGAIIFVPKILTFMTDLLG